MTATCQTHPENMFAKPGFNIQPLHVSLDLLSIKKDFNLENGQK